MHRMRQKRTTWWEKDYAPPKTKIQWAMVHEADVGTRTANKELMFMCCVAALNASLVGRFLCELCNRYFLYLECGTGCGGGVVGGGGGGGWWW